MGKLDARLRTLVDSFVSTHIRVLSVYGRTTHSNVSPRYKESAFWRGENIDDLENGPSHLSQIVDQLDLGQIVFYWEENKNSFR